MSRIIASLIRTVANTPTRAHGIAEVLHYLGYEGVMHCTFSIGLPSRVQNELLSSSDIVAAARNLPAVGPVIPYDSANVFRQIRESDPATLIRAAELMREFKRVKRKPRLDVFLDQDGIRNSDISADDILPLVTTGFAKLRDVSLRKALVGAEATFRLSEASSGEQSVVMGLLGIASQIDDNSLVCIDEPEVCLHPEWQERYVHLLLNTFAHRRNCQFIIATHSPQIVAELPQANCFVMNMEEGKAIAARELSHRSVDFQLASVFKTPGRHNEFLNRIALNLFSKASRTKEFSSEDDETISFLVDLLDRINAADPVRELILALQAMRNVYGRNS
jgi:predicted ATPase